MHIISISGAARAGKTTLARMLSQELYDSGYTPHIISFAEPLKRILAENGITKESCDAEEFRNAAQSLSDQILEQDIDYFVNTMHERIAQLYAEEREYIRAVDPEHHCKVAIIDDMRYPWEVQGLGRYSGMWLHVNHGSRVLPDAKAKWRRHRSESMASELNRGVHPMINSMHFMFMNDSDEQKYSRLVSSTWKHLFPLVENDEHELMCSCAVCQRTRQGKLTTIEQLEMGLRTLEMHTAKQVAKARAEERNEADAEEDEQEDGEGDVSDSQGT